jgi:hypothetical protein
MTASFLNHLIAATDEANRRNFWANLGPLIEYLESGPRIRILVFPGPGLGHQASTVNLLMRLVDLGFSGTAEVFYARRGQDLTEARKLAVLIPGFDGEHPPETLSIPTAKGPPVTLNFVPYDSWERPKAASERCALGFSGGLDWKRDTPGQNYAWFLNVSHLLALQPYRWKEAQSAVFQPPPTGHGDDLLTVLDDQYPDALIDRHGYYLDVPAMDDARYQRFRERDAVKCDRYKRIVAAAGSVADPHGLLLMPVYGLELFDRDYQNEHPEVVAPKISEMILFNLVTGVLHAQDRLRKSRSAVIVVLSNLAAAAYDRLGDIIDGSDRGIEPVFARYLESMRTAFRERLRVLPHDDPNFESTVAWAQSANNRVLLVRMGSVPLDAFNYLYKISGLPGVFEGQGTVNLLLNLGNAYLQLPSPHNEPHDRLYVTLPLAATQPGVAATSMRRLSRLVTSDAGVWNSGRKIKLYPDTHLEHSHPAEAIGSFFKTVADNPEGSSFGRYFSGLKDYFHQPEADKLLNGIFLLCHHMKRNGDSLPADTPQGAPDLHRNSGS